MLKFIIFSLLFTTYCVQCKSDYKFHTEVDGWLKVHKVSATWEEAFLQCYYEGSILASPLTPELLMKMNSLISDLPISYYIGTHAMWSSGQYVSIEGVTLEEMPVSDMYQVLNSEEGQCLSTNGFNISVVSCLKKLPYICYKSYTIEQNLTECGTYDEGYQFQPSTGSCYKVHENFRTWTDANSLCIAEGGYLVILNDDLEASIIQTMIPAIRPDYNWDMRWDPLLIGLRVWGNNDTWLSIHGEPLDRLYNEWDSGQPDPFGYICGALTRLGKLQNIGCQVVSFFVCEKDPNKIRYRIF